MQRNSIRQAAAGFLIVMCPVFASSSPAAADAGPHGETISRALRLLPRPAYKVVVVEADAAQWPPHGKREQVEAFVNHGERVVYLVRQGVTLQMASRGSGIFDYALATVIWHEMAHIDGADELKAQLEEERLWMQFVLAGRVDRVRGLQYLALLKKRRSGD
jgi:hypothetical protein